MKFKVKIVHRMAFIEDLQSHKTFGEKRETFIAYRTTEKELREKGIRVWLCWTKKTNGMMVRILKHLNAKPYFSDETNIYFVKDLREV